MLIVWHFKKLYIAIALFALLGCSGGKEPDEFSTLSNECVLGVQLEWNSELPEEDWFNLQLMLGDELIEYQSALDGVKIGFSSKPGKNELVLFFDEQCERKNEYAHEFFSDQVERTEQLYGYSFFITTYEEWKN